MGFTLGFLRYPTYDWRWNECDIGGPICTGGTYFYTVNLAERCGTLLVDRIDVLRPVMHTVKSRHPFRIDAIVILPDHLHAVWTLPVGDADYPTRWALIKAWGVSAGLG